MPPSTAQIIAVTNAVENASKDVINDAAYRLRQNHFTASRWLGTKNRYTIATIARIDADARSGDPKKTQLSEYLAASVFLHCFDGWSFLSRAVDSLLNGDIATTVHLAYYAELRATMAFLASEGIGVFKGKHFWFDSSGNCNVLNGPGTHDMVWLAVDKWADVPLKGNRLMELFRVEGRSFVDWLTATPFIGPGTVSALARDWLQAWSLDLRVLGADHNLRNEVSYRPQRMVPLRHNINLTESLSRLSDFWRACEPAATGTLGLLDLHLLRRALEQTYRARTGRRPLSTGYASFVDNTLANLAIPRNQLLRSFLLRRQSPTDHPLLVEAKKKSRIIHPLSIVARAMLMLRVTSAAIDNLVRLTSIEKSELGFWWKELGEGIGLWEPGAEPNDMTDLWDEIQSALDAIDDWFQSRPQEMNVLQTRQEFSLDLWQLTQFQRAGLWALGI